MTKAELTQLIIIIYASERRADAPSRAVVEAWHPKLADASFQDACTVVSEHYGTSDRPITLAQLCEGVRKAQAARKRTDRVEDRLRVPDADPDDPEAFIQAMKGQRYLPDRDPDDFTRPALDVSMLGQQMPSGDAVQEKPVRPRRWWMRMLGQEEKKDSE